MGEKVEVRWEGELSGTPEEVWDAITTRVAAFLWEVEYEPRVGGAERGLSSSGGTVSIWDPHRRFRTNAPGNQLDYVLEPSEGGTYLRYTHDLTASQVELDACRNHTRFYNHSLGEYVAHFAGAEPVYVGADAPEGTTGAAIRRALGVPDDVRVGDRVALVGPEPIEGVVDYVTDEFLGVRTDDALFRIYGRERWGFPSNVALHRFEAGADRAAGERAWSEWLDDARVAEAVA